MVGGGGGTIPAEKGQCRVVDRRRLCQNDLNLNTTEDDDDDDDDDDDSGE